MDSKLYWKIFLRVNCVKCSTLKFHASIASKHRKIDLSLSLHFPVFSIKHQLCYPYHKINFSWNGENLSKQHIQYKYRNTSKQYSSLHLSSCWIHVLQCNQMNENDVQSKLKATCSNNRVISITGRISISMRQPLLQFSISFSVFILPYAHEIERMDFLWNRRRWMFMLIGESFIKICESRFTDELMLFLLYCALSWKWFATLLYSNFQMLHRDQRTQYNFHENILFNVIPIFLFRCFGFDTLFGFFSANFNIFLCMSMIKAIKFNVRYWNYETQN